MKKTVLSLMLMTLFASACSHQAAAENTASTNMQATTVKQNQAPSPEIVAVNKLIDEIEPQVAGDKCQLEALSDELKSQENQKEALDYLKQFSLNKNDLCLTLKFDEELMKMPEADMDKLANAHVNSCQQGNIKACRIAATNAFLANDDEMGVVAILQSCEHGDKAACESVQETLSAMKKYTDKSKLYQTVLEMERHTSLIDEEHIANQEVKLVCNDSGYIEAGCFPDTSKFFDAKSVRITPGVKDLAADFELRATLTADTLNGGQIVMKRHKEKWSCIIEKKNSQIDKDYLPQKNCTLVP